MYGRLILLPMFEALLHKECFHSFYKGSQGELDKRGGVKT